jgi:hypothetical protein
MIRREIISQPPDRLQAGATSIGERDDLVDRAARNAPRVGNALRVLRRARRDAEDAADEGVVVHAVVAPLELRDLLPSSSGARHAHRIHRRLGSGVREGDPVGARDRVHHQLGQSNLVLVRDRVDGPVSARLLDRLHDHGMAVSQDQGSVGHGDVHVLVSVDVSDPRASSLLHEGDVLRGPEGTRHRRRQQDRLCPIQDLLRFLEPSGIQFVDAR